MHVTEKFTKKIDGWKTWQTLKWMDEKCIDENKCRRKNAKAEKEVDKKWKNEKLSIEEIPRWKSEWTKKCTDEKNQYEKNARRKIVERKFADEKMPDEN